MSFRRWLMVGRLDGKVSIVTGAGQGIGRGIALALAKEGARVALVGRTPGKLEAVEAEIADLGAQALSAPCDVGDRAEVGAMVAAVVGRWGTVDAVVNNAQ